MQAKERGINRRDFLKGALAAGALGAAGAIGGCSKSSEAAPSSSGGTAEKAMYTWEKVPSPIPDSKITKTVDTEIVIVGAGIAGMTAAQSAAEAGAKVVVIEKMEKFSARGLDNGAIGTKFQLGKGINIDKRYAEEIFSEWAGNKIDRRLFRVWADNSGAIMDEYIDRMSKAGIEVQLSGTAIPGRDQLDFAFKEYLTPLEFGQGWFTETGEWVESRFIGKLEEWAKAAGADIQYKTKAEQLIREGQGKVTGVVASLKDGSYVKFNASKAVILATGDIAGNDEMLGAWAPLALKVDARAYTPEGGNSGDGHLMALWAGAAIQKCNSAPMIHPLPMKAGPLAAQDLCWLAVNKNGERFMNEFSNTPGIANARLTQPGNVAYSIFDGAFKEKALKQVPSGMSLTGLPIIDDKIDATFETALKNKTLFKADTLEALAEAIGAPKDAFTATVARYNELVAKGADEDFSTPSKWLTSIDTPPFYASWIPATLLVVPFGLNVDSHSQVCGEDDKPIEGLYAIGNIQGNFFANDYPLITPGVSHGRCIVWGNLLGKALASGTQVKS